MASTMSRPGAVLEARHLGADLVVAPGLAPQVGRVHDRHLHLLPADGVDLLADDLLDPLLHPKAERQERVDAGSELAQVAAAHEQPMRRHLGIGRVVAQGGEEETREAHGRRF